MCNTRSLIGLMACTLLVLACGKDELVPPNLTVDDPEAFVIDGTVHFLNIEGGCWVIETQDGARYEPFGMPLEFETDGLRVRAAVKPKRDALSICMVGTLVEVVEIDRYKKG